MVGSFVLTDLARYIPSNLWEAENRVCHGVMPPFIHLYHVDELYLNNMCCPPYYKYVVNNGSMGPRNQLVIICINAYLLWTLNK